MPKNNSFNNSTFKKFLKKKKYKKIFLITGKNSFYKSKAFKILKFLSDKKVDYYFKKSSIPKFQELVDIIKVVDKFKPDLILAVGGGAVIDYAKIVSIASISSMKSLKKKIIKYKSFSKEKIYPLIAIPTTAGAGAEVTSNAVIYVNNVKYSVESSLLIPDKFVLLKELVINNPFQLKSSAGFDAIAQAVESLISMKSNNTSVNYAKKSLSLSLKYYLSFLKRPNHNNANKMLIASNLAGKAINISKTTAPHAVSYPFTSLFGLSHGHAVSLTLEKFLLFNYLNLPLSRSNFNLKKRYQIIFKLFKVNDINGLCKKIKKIKNEAKLEDSLKKLNINVRFNLEKILSQINVLRLKNNPVEIKKKDIKKIFND